MSGEAEANVILSFVDENGARWIAAAFLGELQVDGEHTKRMPVDEMIDHVMVLVDFKVVRRGP